MQHTQELTPFEESINTITASISIKDSVINFLFHAQIQEYIEFAEKRTSHLERKIGLWEGTCFEVFIGTNNSKEYLEFNFSGTGMWNVFHFEERGQELKEFNPLKLLKHRFIKRKREREFSFSFDLNNLPFKYEQNGLKVGMTTILNNEDQEKQYFAFRHNKNQPDFHDPESFILLK